MIDKTSPMWKAADAESRRAIPHHLIGEREIPIDTVIELMTIAFLRGVGWQEEQAQPNPPHPGQVHARRRL